MWGGELFDVVVGVGVFLEAGVDEGGLDAAGADAVDADSGVAEVHGDGSSEAEQGVFGCDVGEAVFHSGVGGDRADVDDGTCAVLDHGGQDGLAESEGSHEVNVPQAGDILFRCIPYGSDVTDSGIIDEDIAAAVVFIEHHLNEAPAILRAGDIGLVDFGFTTGRQDKFQSIGGGGFIAVGEVDQSALGGEGLGDGGPDAGAGSGDDGDFVS